MLDSRTESRRIEQAALFLKEAGGPIAGLAVVLGSGLGDFLSLLETVHWEWPYSEIPHFPVSSVAGHCGKLVLGELEGVPLMVMAGRVHYYEGYPMHEVVFPIRVLLQVGVRTLILTNAAGGVNRSFQAGDLMLMTDHINLLGGNPLSGPNLEAFGPRFPDMSEIYDHKLRHLALAVATRMGFVLRQGVYLATAGPSYETPAEIEMFRRLGADAVGMSTVPEAIAANHAGAKVVGISCITNMAAGVLPQKLHHDEVLATTVRVRETFARLLSGTIRSLRQEEYC